jgi:SAM-dependent methyltransferase
MVQQLPMTNQPTITPLSSQHCPSCGHEGLLPFYEVQNIPVHSCLMLPTRQDALNFPTDNLALSVCHRCGFITNPIFDSRWSAYAPNYEDQQSFSGTFNQFAFNLAQRLVEKYDLHNKDIVEIGCSKGDFLLLLCELGRNRGVGIDPSVVPGRVESEAVERVTFIQDYYSENHAEYVGEFICCRHTLEHIRPTAELVQTVRKSIGDRQDTVVFFEIPDTTRVLRDLAFEDIYYEHCSYFTPGSLARLFRSCGFEVIDLYRAYADQYLMIEARPVTSVSRTIHPFEETLEQTLADVQFFRDRIDQKLNYWRQRLAEIEQRKERVVIWGSGSKCVSFLTTLNAVNCIDYVVDINPHRHGRFIPGLGKEIMSPEFLKDYKPKQVIVMNAIYSNEIQQKLNEMGVSAEVVAI